MAVEIEKLNSDINTFGNVVNSFQKIEETNESVKSVLESTKKSEDAISKSADTLSKAVETIDNQFVGLNQKQDAANTDFANRLNQGFGAIQNSGQAIMLKVDEGNKSIASSVQNLTNTNNNLIGTMTAEISELKSKLKTAILIAAASLGTSVISVIVAIISCIN